MMQALQCASVVMYLCAVYIDTAAMYRDNDRHFICSRMSCALTTDYSLTLTTLQC
jgi:hypothetical protein